jgi:hypothetical protein
MTPKNAKRFSVDVVLQLIEINRDDVGYRYPKSPRSLRRAYNMQTPVRSKKMAG